MKTEDPEGTRLGAAVGVRLPEEIGVTTAETVGRGCTLQFSCPPKLSKSERIENAQYLLDKMKPWLDW